MPSRRVIQFLRARDVPKRIALPLLSAPFSQAVEVLRPLAPSYLSPERFAAMVLSLRRGNFHPEQDIR